MHCDPSRGWIQERERFFLSLPCSRDIVGVCLSACGPSSCLPVCLRASASKSILCLLHVAAAPRGREGGLIANYAAAAQTYLVDLSSGRGRSVPSFSLLRRTIAILPLTFISGESHNPGGFRRLDDGVYILRLESPFLSHFLCQDFIVRGIRRSLQYRGSAAACNLDGPRYHNVLRG